MQRDEDLEAKVIENQDNETKEKRDNKRKKAKTREPPAAPPVSASIEIGSSAAGKISVLTDPEIVEQCRQDVKKLINHLMLENGVAETAMLDPQSSAVLEAHHQSLLAFAAAQSALAMQTYKFTEQFTLHTEEAASKAHTLNQSNVSNSKELGSDLTRAQEEIEKLTALRTTVDNLATCVEKAHQTVQFVVPIVEVNLSNTLSTIGEADAEYKAARAALDLELQELESRKASLEQQAAEGTVTADLLTAEKLRISHEQSEILSNFGDLSTQRLQAARELLESVKSSVEPGVASQQANIAEECTTQAEESFQAINSIKEWFDTAAQRIAQVTAAEVHSAGTDSLHTEAISAHAAEERIASLSAQLHACFVALEWVAAEATENNVVLPATEASLAVSQSDAQVMLERGLAASKSLSACAQTVVTLSPETVSGADTFYVHLEAALAAYTHCTQTVAQIKHAAQETLQLAEQMERLAAEYMTAAEDAVYMIETQAVLDGEQSTAAEEEFPPLLNAARRNPRSSLGNFTNGRCLSTSSIYMPPDEEEVGFAEVNPFINATPRRGVRKGSSGQLTTEATMSPLTARHRAMQLVIAARSSDERAEELAVEVEKIATSLQASAVLAEKATRNAEAAVGELDAELTAMVEFKARADVVSTEAQTALLATNEAAGVLSALKVSVAVSIQETEEVANAELDAIEKEEEVLRNEMAAVEAQWEADDAAEGIRLAQRAVFAQQLVDLRERQHTVVVQNQAAAEARAVDFKTHIDQADVQEKASNTSKASAAAQNLRENFRTTEAAIGAAQMCTQDAEKVNVAAEGAIEGKVNARVAVAAAETAALAASFATSEAWAAIAEYEVLGETFQDKDFSDPDVVADRAQRCIHALQGVDAAADKIAALQGAAQLASQHAATKCGQTVTARAVGYIALARASEAGQQALETAHKASEVQAELLLILNNDVASWREKCNEAQEKLDNARVAAREAERLRMEQLERGEAELRLANQRAAIINAQHAIDAATQAEGQLQQLTQEAESIAIAVDESLLESQHAFQSAESALASVTNGATTLQKGVADSAVIFNTINDLRSQTAALASGCTSFQQESVSYIVTVDATFAQKHLEIEQAAVELDGVLAAAAHRWHQEGYSAVQNATERLSLAVQGSVLMNQVHDAAVCKQSAIGAHLVQVVARADATEAEVMENKALVVVKEAAEMPQISVAVHDRTSDADLAMQQAAEKSALIMQRVSDNRGKLSAVAEAAERASEDLAVKIAAVREAMLACKQVGADSPECRINWDENRDVGKESVTNALRRVTDVVDQVTVLNERTQTAVTQVVAECAKIIKVKEELDKTLAMVLETYDQIVGAAAVAKEAHQNALTNAQSALLRAKTDVASSMQAAEEARFAVADVESGLVEALTAQRLQQEAELLAKQQAAQSQAQELLVALVSAEAEAEKSTAELESLAASLKQIVQSAQEVSTSAEVSRMYADSQVPVLTAYQQRTEELSAAAENAVLSTTLEANVAEEHRDASAQRIALAEEALQATRKEVETALHALEDTVRQAEPRWETDGTNETARAEERVLFATQRAELLSKILVAVESREAAAIEHVELTKSHTEAVDAQRKAEEVLTAARTASSLHSDTRFPENMRGTGMVCARLLDSANEASTRAKEVEAQAQRARVVALESAVWYAQTEDNMATAIALCVELGASALALDANRADSVSRRDARCGEALRQVQEHFGQINTLTASVQDTITEATSAWGKAVAAQTLGDLAVASMVELAQDAEKDAARALAVHDDTIASAEAALVRTRNEVKTAKEDVECAKIAVSLAERTCLSIQEQKARAEAEQLRLQQQAARNAALEQLKVTKAAEMRAEELSFEIERLALTLEQTTQLAEEAAALASRSELLVTGECAAMEQFVNRSNEYKPIVNQARESVQALNKRCVEQAQDSTESIFEANETYAGARNTFEQEAIHLHDAIELHEAKWARDNVPPSQQAAQRVAFALENAGLMLELFDAAVSRQYQAVEHVNLVRGYKETIEAQEQASAASAAASKATEEQTQAHSLEIVVSAVKTSNLAAEKVAGALKTAGSVERDITDKVQSVLMAELEASQVAATAKASVAACEEVGGEAPEFNVAKLEDTQRRAQRCSDAQIRVETCLARLHALQTATQRSVQQVTTQFDTVTTLRAAGEASVSYVLAVAEEVNALAGSVNAQSSTMIQKAEEALAQCKAEATACGVMEENARLAAETANVARVAAEKEENERLSAEATEQERSTAETLAAKQLAAQQKIVELTAAWRAADQHAEELSFLPETLSGPLDDFVQIAAEAASTAIEAVAAANTDWTFADEFRSRAEDIQGTAEKALLAATTEAQVTEGLCETLYQRIEFADSDYLTEQALIDEELRVFDAGVEETERNWRSENVPESVILAKLAAYAHTREEIVAKKVAIVTIREELAMDHVVEAGGISVEPAEPMVQIARDAADSARTLEENTEFPNSAVSAAEASRVTGARSSAAAEQASVVRDQVHKAVLDAAEAAKTATQLAAELQRAVDECVKIGAEFTAPYLSSALLLAQREERVTEVEASVNETVDNILELNESVQSSVQQTITLSTDTDAACTEGLGLIARTQNAAQQAAVTVHRVRVLEEQLCADAETALVRARNEFKPARQAVVEARTAAAEAERARLAAEETDAVRGAAELLQNARSAAGAKVEQQRAMFANAKDLIEEAEAAESMAEERIEFAEELAESLAMIELELNELSQHVSGHVEPVQNTFTAVSAYRDETESLFHSANQAMLTVTARAAACEDNSTKALSRIHGTDGSLGVDQSALADEIRMLDAAAAEAEARWHTEGTAATERTAQRAVFAKDRARLVSRMSAAAAKRALIANEQVIWLKQQSDAQIAKEKASVVVATAAHAHELQLSVCSNDVTAAASETCTLAAEQAESAAQRAADCESTFRATVLSATKASKAATLACSDAAAAIADCEKFGVEAPKYPIPGPEAESDRSLRCSELTEKALDCIDRIQILHATIQRAAQKVIAQCVLVSRTKEEADSFVSRTADMSSEATTRAVKTTEIECETLASADAALLQARAEAKAASEEGRAAHLAAILAVQAHNAAHESESCGDTMSVGSMFTATSNATSEMPAGGFTNAAESSCEDLIRSAQEAIQAADEEALAAERAAFALEHVTLAAEDAAMAVKGAVGVVHGELVYMEAFRTDLEKLQATAEKAQQAVSLELTAAQEKSEASALRMKTADDELAAERAVLDDTLSVLHTSIAAAESQWENSNTPETVRARQCAIYAQERAETLGKLSVALVAREQKATEHLAFVKAHTELVSAQKKANIASTTATVASNVQNETRSTNQAKHGAAAGARCVEKTLELCKQAAEARENVHLAVHKSLQAAKTYEKIAFVAQNSEKRIDVPAYDLERRSQRCADALKRVDENAERIETLSNTVKQTSEEAVVKCEQAIVARTAGDLSATQTQDASREAAMQVEQVSQITNTMIAAAEESLSWTRIQAQSAAKEAQLATTEATAMQANLTRSQMSTQEAALATVNDLLNAARAAAALAEEKTVDVETIATTLVSTVRTAEEASMMAKGAVGLVHGELVYMEAYRKDAEAMASIISTPEPTGRKSPKKEQKSSAFEDSLYDTLAQRIANADANFAKEREPLEKKIQVLAGTMAVSEQRWRLTEEPEVNRATQRASFAQARFKLMEKVAATAAARLVVAEKHMRHAKAQCESTTPTSESISGKSNSASVATDLQSETRSPGTALQASFAGQSAAQRAVTAADKATEAESQVNAAADAAKAAMEKYFLAEKAARAAIASYTVNGIKVPEYDTSLTDEVSLRTQRRLQAVKRVAESADYVAMLNDSAQLSSTQASEQYTRTVKERARGDLAIARVVNPSASTDLANLAAAEEALLRCTAEAQAAEQAAAQAKEASLSFRKSKVNLQSMSSRSNLGLFLKQEFGEVESHLVTGPVSVSPFSSSPSVKARKAVAGPSGADDPNAGSQVDQSYIQPIIPEQGTHRADTPEIWNLTGEALERHRAAQAEEKAHAARQVAPIKRAQIYEVRRLQSKKRSFHVKELRKKRVSTAADGTAEQLEDKIEQISNDVEEALFAAEADVNIIAEAGAALRDQVTWMEDFQSKADKLHAATAETLLNAKAFVASVDSAPTQSPSTAKSLVRAATEHAHYGTQMCTWYTLELANSAQQAVENAEARVAQAGTLIEAHIAEAEIAIDTILEMYSAATAPSPLAERAKSRSYDFNMVRSHSENTLSSLSDGEHDDSDENSFVRNARDVRRVLALAQEMMHIASTRSKKLLENATLAYQRTVEAHVGANKTVQESLDAANVTICTLQQVSTTVVAPTANSAEKTALQLEILEAEVYHSPDIMVSHSPFRYSYKNSSGETSLTSSPGKMQQRFSADFTDAHESGDKMAAAESKDASWSESKNDSVRSHAESILEEKSAEGGVPTLPVAAQAVDSCATLDTPAVAEITVTKERELPFLDTNLASPVASVVLTPTHSSAQSTPVKEKDPKSKKRHSLMSNMLGGLFSGKKDKSGKSAAGSPMPPTLTPGRATPPVSPVRRNSIAGAVLSPAKSASLDK